MHWDDGKSVQSNAGLRLIYPLEEFETRRLKIAIQVVASVCEQEIGVDGRLRIAGCMDERSGVACLVAMAFGLARQMNEICTSGKAQTKIGREGGNATLARAGSTGSGRHRRASKKEGAVVEYRVMVRWGHI